MKKFIALLRGINVSGQKKIKMSDLKLLFEEMGFKDVQTYIQSGNVIFSSKEISVDKLELKISSAIKRKFGFDVQVIILSQEEIEYTLKNNPFIKRKKEDDRLYVTFLSNAPSKENIQRLNSTDYSPEEYIIDGKLVYLYLPNGAGKAKINNNLFENKLKVDGTTRNWKTVNALSELAK
jgi:uncharacterized protein (DUF1697 family)